MLNLTLLFKRLKCAKPIILFCRISRFALPLLAAVIIGIVGVAPLFARIVL